MTLESTDLTDPPPSFQNSVLVYFLKLVQAMGGQVLGLTNSPFHHTHLNLTSLKDFGVFFMSRVSRPKHQLFSALKHMRII